MKLILVIILSVLAMSCGTPSSTKRCDRVQYYNVSGPANTSAVGLTPARPTRVIEGPCLDREDRQRIFGKD